MRDAIFPGLEVLLDEYSKQRGEVSVDNLIFLSICKCHDDEDKCFMPNLAMMVF
jgi:hypothetical protein